MTCVQCQVGFRGGGASCSQLSYCQNVICSLTDDLCTCQVNFRGEVASCGQVSYCEDGVCSLNDGLCTVSGELQGGCQLLSGLLLSRCYLFID